MRREPTSGDEPETTDEQDEHELEACFACVDVERVFGDLSETLAASGRLERAELLTRRVVSWVERSEGSEAPALDGPLCRLVGQLAAQRKFAEARTQCSRLARLRLKVWGDSDERTQAIHAMMALLDTLDDPSE